MSNYKGNLTTIVKFCVMTIAPYLGVSEATSNSWVAVIVACIGLLLAYFDAKYDNTLLSQPNIQEVVESEESAINPEYTTGIGDDDGC